MGITGLIPFLERASKRENISKFSGGTVAIDSYCWLHKGAFACADKIALGQPTDGHVKYCMKFVHMLLANRIKPILVFDGRHLPAKKETEVKRRENREALRRRAAELMRMGQTGEGRNLLRRCIDITHELALQLIKKCQEENVDCIVAPYEADAQLAYLNICGIADVVITEDSDLTLFGCKKIFFKMDINGNGVLVEQERLHLAMKIPADHFNMDKFRHMCILSGCDYLDSLPGIGLSKACKFVLRCIDGDIYNSLSRLGPYLNMKSLVVTKEYRDAFIRALITFKHQLVYCPLKRQQVRLFPPPPEVTDEQLQFAGNAVSEDVAWQLALGNLDPFTMKKLHDFDPDVSQIHRGKTNSWHRKPTTTYPSIWSRGFKINEGKENSTTDEITKWPDTAGRVIVLNTQTIKRKTTPKKRNFGELATELSNDDMLELYGSKKLQKNDKTSDSRSTPPPRLDSSSSMKEEITSPKSSRQSNPFLKSLRRDGELSPSLLYRGKRRIKLKNVVGFRATVIDENVVEKSKYFNTDSTCEEPQESISTDCVTIIGSVRDKTSSKNVVRDKSNENYVTDLNMELQSNEETSSSSGVFTSGPSSEQDCDMNLSPEQKSCEISLINETEEESRTDNNSLSLDRLLTTKCDIASHNSNVSNVSLQENHEELESSFRNDSSLKSNFFKWTNPKVATNTTVKSIPQRKIAIASAKQQSNKATKKKVPQKKVISVESQHSLQMFGFQKKPVLKH